MAGPGVRSQAVAGHRTSVLKLPASVVDAE